MSQHGVASEGLQRGLLGPVQQMADDEGYGGRGFPLLGTQARALETGKARSARIRSFLRGSFSLLVFALRRSGKLATTMEARGFGAAGRRTWARPSRLRAADAVLLLVAIALPSIALAVSVIAGTFALVGR